MNCLLALTFIDFLLTKAAVIPIYDHLVCLAGVRKLAGDCVKEIRKSDVSSSIDVKAIIVELAMSHVRLSEKVISLSYLDDILIIIKEKKGMREVEF